MVERLIILSGNKITKADVLNFVHLNIGKSNQVFELFDKYNTLQDLQMYIKTEYETYKGVLI